MIKGSCSRLGGSVLISAASTFSRKGSLLCSGPLDDSCLPRCRVLASRPYGQLLAEMKDLGGGDKDCA